MRCGNCLPLMDTCSFVRQWCSLCSVGLVTPQYWPKEGEGDVLPQLHLTQSFAILRYLGLLASWEWGVMGEEFSCLWDVWKFGHISKKRDWHYLWLADTE